jgi:hypothetical protein
MLDIFVAEIVLQGAGIVAIIGELVPTSMAQHVRMDRERHPGGFPEALDKPMKADWAHWSTTLRNEYVGVFGLSFPHFSEGALDMLVRSG